MPRGFHNTFDKGSRRGGGKAKFAQYWETLRTSRPVSRGCSFIVRGEFATIPLAPHHHCGFPKHAGSPIAFLRHRGIYRSDRASLLKNLDRGAASRWSGPDQVKERAERITSCPSSAMSSDRLSLIGVLASIARLRFTGRHRLTCAFHQPRQKGTFLLCQQGDISTLP